MEQSNSIFLFHSIDAIPILSHYIHSALESQLKYLNSMCLRHALHAVQFEDNAEVVEWNEKKHLHNFSGI